MTHMLRSLAGGRVVLCLEGGYNVTSISYAMTMCTKALLGDPLTHHYDPKPTCNPSAIESINNVIRTQKQYWKSLKFQLALPIENVLEDPLPSRGLVLSNDQNTTDESEKLAELSLDSSVSSKNSSRLDQSLENQMAGLSLDKCKDGVHCGSDDEDHNVAGSSRGKESSGKPTLVDYLAENMQAIVDGDMFAVIPMPWCPHLETIYAIPIEEEFVQGTKCVECEEITEIWVCLHCFVVSIMLLLFCLLNIDNSTFVLLEARYRSTFAIRTGPVWWFFTYVIAVPYEDIIIILFVFCLPF
jgi:histone deacetylase 6